MLDVAREYVLGQIAEPAGHGVLDRDAQDDATIADALRLLVPRSKATAVVDIKETEEGDAEDERRLEGREGGPAKYKVKGVARR